MTRTVTITIMMVTHDQRTRQDGSNAPYRHSSRLAESGPAKLEDPGPGPAGPGPPTRPSGQGRLSRVISLARLGLNGRAPGRIPAHFPSHAAAYPHFFSESP
jgi:hypothetical protein